MRAVSKRFSVVSGFLILLTLLAVNTYIIRRQLGIQVNDQQWVTNARQVSLELAETESLLNDAETGQRGYLYTGEQKYLAPYKIAIAQVDGHIRRLMELTADDAGHQGRIVRLRGLVQQKLKELSLTIALFQSGETVAARAVVLSDLGRSTMDKIRSLNTEMQREESSTRATRAGVYRKSIQLTIVCIYVASICAGLGLVLLAIFILREMALRERHAAHIVEREAWFRVTLTSIGDGIIVTDEQGCVTFMNSEAERLTGTSLAPAKGKPMDAIFPIFNEATSQRVESPVKKVLELGSVLGLTKNAVLEHRDGTLIPIENSASPIRDDQGKLIGVVFVFRDASRERKFQDVLRRTEKLAAGARLGATIAHEINNPLEAIGNLIYLVKTSPGLPAGAAEDLRLAEHELDRVAHIARQTLGFYRESKMPDTVHIRNIVDTVLRLYLHRIQMKHIKLDCNFEDCPPIQGIAGELHQLISNLICNALDAVADNGTLRVGVSSIERTEGKAVQLKVEDNGIGIAAESLEQIFEPFYTTKKDVGTGLGLWVSKQIAERHGGTIQAYSQNIKGARGAVFTVLLPCAADLLSPETEAV